MCAAYYIYITIPSLAWIQPVRLGLQLGTAAGNMLLAVSSLFGQPENWNDPSCAVLSEPALVCSLFPLVSFVCFSNFEMQTRVLW